MIVTSCWFSSLPPNHQRIGISRGVPRGQNGFRRYLALNPGPWFNSTSADEFRVLYFELLAKLDAEKVISDLIALSARKTPALLCWEHPENKLVNGKPNCCHRALISVWLEQELGLEVYEFGYEHEGCGWAHPKIFPGWRLRQSLA